MKGTISFCIRDKTLPISNNIKAVNVTSRIVEATTFISKYKKENIVYFSQTMEIEIQPLPQKNELFDSDSGRV